MASCYTETPEFCTWLQDETVEDKDKEPQYPEKNCSDLSEDSEPEIPPSSLVYRKVSFADAFGLDLVSVKEFDSGFGTGPTDSEPLLGREAKEKEEYYLFSIFNVPESDDELKLRVRQNKLELESIELMPCSTTIRGTVRVLNLSYHKEIYVHTTMDGWQSHFDLLAEYVPGSSDGETDRFSFKLTLIPPFPVSGVRVEFCFRYESTTGTFWANNGGMNYVLFFQQREGRTVYEKEDRQEKEVEENSNMGKKSCLKVLSKQSCAEFKPTSVNTVLSESTRCDKSTVDKTQNKADQSKDPQEGSCDKTSAERQNRWRAACLEPIQPPFAQVETEIKLGHPSHRKRGVSGLKVELPAQQLGFPTRIKGTPTTPAEYEIPLFSLDWSKHRSFSHPHNLMISRDTNPDDSVKILLMDNTTKSCSDAWEEFLNGKDNHINTQYQEFLLCATGSSSSQPLNKSYDNDESGINRGIGSSLCLRSDGTQRVKFSEPFDLCHTSEEWHLGYTYTDEKLAFGTHTIQEMARAQWQPEWSGATEIPYDIQRPTERCGKDTIPWETAEGTETQNSKVVDDVLLEQCVGSLAFLGSEEKMKGETQRPDDDILTFTGVRNKSFTDRYKENRGSLDREHTDERREPRETNEHISNENASSNPINMRKSWRKYSEGATVLNESEISVNFEDVSHLQDLNTEIGTQYLILRCNTETLQSKSEGHEETCFASQIICRNDNEGLDMNSHKEKEVGATNNLNTDTSRYLHQRESFGEGDRLLFLGADSNFEVKAPPKNEALKDLRDSVEEEISSSNSSIVTSSVGAWSAWLSVWLVNFCSLRYVSGPLGYIILFVIFITTYLHDISVCLVIYLLSVCFWYKQDIKNRVTTADSVD